MRGNEVEDNKEGGDRRRIEILKQNENKDRNKNVRRRGEQGYYKRKRGRYRK